MLFLLYQAKFVMDIYDPTICKSLMLNLQNRTKQRRHYLTVTHWDTCEDKTRVTRKPPKEVKHMNAADWWLLFDSWSMSLFT